jgi:hypothetical protein
MKRMWCLGGGVEEAELPARLSKMFRCAAAGAGRRGPRPVLEEAAPTSLCTDLEDSRTKDPGGEGAAGALGATGAARSAFSWMNAIDAAKRGQAQSCTDTSQTYL